MVHDEAYWKESNYSSDDYSLFVEIRILVEDCGVDLAYVDCRLDSEAAVALSVLLVLSLISLPNDKMTSTRTRAF